MAGNPFRFDRTELAGSLGDLGTLIPLSIALIAVTGLSFTPVIGLVGLFYIATGLYFRLPVPVQPLKVVSALAIAFPGQVTPEVMAACGLLFALTLLALAATGIIDLLSRLFTKPIVRGVQLGLGMILMSKGIGLITSPNLFLGPDAGSLDLAGLPLNPVLGVAGVLLALGLLNSKRFPAALVLVGAGLAVGLGLGRVDHLGWGPSEVRLFMPGLNDMWFAFTFLVLPQIPLTIGNAVIGTRQTAVSLFGSGEVTARMTDRKLCVSMGLANLAAGLMAAMPMCHGSGGLAAHYRFGARSGGSNLFIGLVFLAVAVFVGQSGVSLLAVIPQAMLGVLLLFAGLELALLIRDVTERAELFIVLLIAGVALATTNMAVAFISGMAVAWVIRRFGVAI